MFESPIRINITQSLEQVQFYLRDPEHKRRDEFGTLCLKNNLSDPFNICSTDM